MARHGIDDPTSEEPTNTVARIEPSHSESGINLFMQARFREFMGPFGIGTAAINAMTALYALKGLAGKAGDVLRKMIDTLAGFGIHVSKALVDQLVSHPVRSTSLITGLALVFALHGPILVALLEAAGFGSLGPISGTMASAIQATVYGGAVPAGGVFAFLQSLAMIQ